MSRLTLVAGIVYDLHMSIIPEQRRILNMNSKPAFYPGETVKSRMSADERLNLELAREMKWYERTGRTDHLPGEIRHTRYQDGVPVETKVLPPLEEYPDEQDQGPEV